MGTNRAIWDGIPEGLNGDRTTTGAYAISSLPNFSTEGIGALRHGDKTTPCPDCGQAGELIGNIPFVNLHGRCAAGNGAVVICGCPPGSNYLISPAGPVGKSRLQSTRIVGQPDPVQHAQATHRHPHRQPANQHEEALPTTCACIIEGPLNRALRLRGRLRGTERWIIGRLPHPGRRPDVVHFSSSPAVVLLPLPIMRG